MLSADFPGEVHATISDAWLDGGDAPAGDVRYKTDRNGRRYFDCTVMNDGTRTMRPRGIVVNSVNGNNDPSVVAGVLWAENVPVDLDDHPIPIGVMHPLALKAVYEFHTSARGIRIYG